MKRIAGMTIDGDRAALVVLVRDGERWRVESADRIDIGEPYRIGCMGGSGLPVILDAGAWWQDRRAGMTFGPPALRLLAAGWDVRPPLWHDGKPANPSDTELAGAWGAIGCPTLRPMPDKATAHALLLAAWGATHDTSAEPPGTDSVAVRRALVENPVHVTIASEPTEAERLLLALVQAEKADRASPGAARVHAYAAQEDARAYLQRRGLLREGA